MTYRIRQSDADFGIGGFDILMPYQEGSDTIRLEAATSGDTGPDIEDLLGRLELAIKRMFRVFLADRQRQLQ